MDAYERRIADFLAAEKVAITRIRWAQRNHPYFLESRISLRTDGPRRPRGYVILASHIYLEPRKYNFSLFFGHERVLALNVDPHRYHRLTLKRQSINSTHWHQYGREEELDSRTMSHGEWLDEFWKRARITYRLAYTPPVHDKIQLKLL